MESQGEDLSKYGANIMLATRTNINDKLTSDINRSFIFAENECGKFQFGSDFTASTIMSYGAQNIVELVASLSGEDRFLQVQEAIVIKNDTSGELYLFLNLGSAQVQVFDNNDNSINTAGLTSVTMDNIGDISIASQSLCY